eukprot:scaffold1055_cov165-Amphora_coffeaeformis.AAC.18
MRNTSFLVLLLLSSFQGLVSTFSSVDFGPRGRRARWMTATATSSCCVAKWKVLTTTRLSATGSAENEGFFDVEITKMDDLILSLSMERDDAQRRDKVAQVLGEKLLQPNGLGSSDRFAQLFDERLTAVGENVRTQATAQAEAGGENGRPSEDTGKQLWALVDMMVQSKIIFKKAREDGLVG